MMNEIKSNLETAKAKAIDSLQHQLTKLRTGRANAAVLDGIKVDYYGSATPINQVGQISTPEARLLCIQPFDKTLISEIEKAIFGSNIGLTPSNDGNLIRIPFPTLTEEKRKDIVKDLKRFGEDAKVSVRNARRDQNEMIKKAEKGKDISEDESKKFHAEIQTLTDVYISEIEKIVKSKEQEILEV